MHACHRLITAKKGATLIEFALIAPTMMVMLMGFFDLGYRTYLEVAARGILETAARNASVGKLTGTQVDTYVTDKLKGIASARSTVTLVKKSFYSISHIGKPEKITTDFSPLGSYNIGDCYEDANNNQMYDSSTGSNGLGGPDDIVYYEVNIAMPRLFPLGSLIGWGNTLTAKANTMIRNQPWGAQTKPSVRCS
nr:TadE family protein [Aquisediminimonas sediminicola]